MRTRLAAARVFADEVSYKGFMASGMNKHLKMYCLKNRGRNSMKVSNFLGLKFHGKLRKTTEKTEPLTSLTQDCVCQTWRRGGVAGLYAGCLASMLEIAPYTAIAFTSYEGLEGTWFQLAY